MTQWGLDTLFNPAKRHMDEEKRRLQSTRAEIGDNSGGKRINLDSGKVVIPRSNEDDESSDEASDGTAKKPAESARLSPAAERAAKRRARKSTT